MDAELKYHNDWLLVFIDDTGHETYAGTHNYYGLGGCVVLGAHYDWLKGQWREVRRLINGSPDAPLMRPIQRGGALVALRCYPNSFWIAPFCGLRLFRHEKQPVLLVCTRRCR